MANDRRIPFFKMTGGGNDFVLFDNRKDQIPKNYPQIARKVCDRRFSIGADGILVLEKEPAADFRMVYYNADGSRAEMCGNGARCIARFAHLVKAADSTVRFVTDAGPMSAQVRETEVDLHMGEPKDMRLDFPIKLDGREFSVSFINTGVPHTVIFVTDIEKINVKELGKAIRNHKEFAPAGTNVNFVLHRDNHNLTVRTYERGVEDETLACGTGVVASSLIAAAKGFTQSPVACLTRGMEILSVRFTMNPEDRRFSEVYLSGPAVVAFQGEIEL